MNMETEIHLNLKDIDFLKNKYLESDDITTPKKIGYLECFNDILSLNNKKYLAK